MNNYNTQALLNNDDISYYLLGAFITDGCVSKKNNVVTITSVDQDWIKNIANILAPNNNICLYKKKYYQLNLCNKEIKQWFIENCCVPNKSLTVQLPNIPKKYISDFIRGCIDGDGTLSLYKKRAICRLYSSSKDFLLAAKDILDNMDFSTHFSLVSKRKRFFNKKEFVAKEHYILTINQSSLISFIKWLYYEDYKLALNRKAIKATEILNLLSQPHKSKFDIGCKIKWVEDDVLVNMINKSSYKDVAKELGVSASAISARLTRRGLKHLITEKRGLNFKKQMRE